MDILCVVHGGVVVYRQTSISNDDMENKIDCHYLCLVKRIVKMCVLVCENTYMREVWANTFRYVPTLLLIFPPHIRGELFLQLAHAVGASNK